MNSTSYKWPFVLHAGLVFPRNETYEPGDLMPIIFGFNDSPYDLIRPQIQYTLSGDGADQTMPVIPVNNTPALDDPSHKTVLMPFWTDKFAQEGHYKISWTVNVEQCDINLPDPQNLDYLSNYSLHPNGTKPLEFKPSTDEEALAVYFTVQAGGLARNLSSIHNDSCRAGPGVAFNITNAPPRGPFTEEGGCFLYDKDHPFTSSSSCHIGTNSSMDGEIYSIFDLHYLLDYCNSTNPPKSLHCYKRNAAVQAIGNGVVITMFIALLTILFIY